MAGIKDFVAGLFSGGVKEALSPVKDIVLGLTVDPDKKIEATEALDKAQKDFDAKIIEIAAQVETKYLDDVDSARKLQVAALGQDDRFAKRFIYYLATFVVLLVFVFDIMMFFVHYPADNRDMINQVSGILNATALVMVLGFFFGSSMGSKKAGEALQQIASKE